MSFFSTSTSSATQSVVQQALAGTGTKPLFELTGPPTLPPGARQRGQEIKAQARCRTHARSTPYSSGKRW